MKQFLWILMLLLLAGCGRDRIADIATTEEITDKTLLFILPSIPVEFCYADRMMETLNCSDYGFSNCVTVDMGIGDNNKHSVVVECLSDDEQHICLFLLGNEYRDVEGDTFDETCILGVDKTVQ